MCKSAPDTCLRLGSGFVAVAALLTIAAQPLFADPRDEGVEEQIERVETGLLPPVLMDGETPKDGLVSRAHGGAARSSS